VIPSTASPPLVEIEGLSVRLQQATLLEDINLRLQPASIHVLSGPNGGGKTTLLRAILGQVPFEGTIRCHWRGGGRIGYVPQRLDFDREIPLTVEGFLAMMWQRRAVCLGTGRSTVARISAALERVGMEKLMRRRFGVLSGGELQRVLLAQALEPTPEILLLDEPTSSIDDAGMRAIEERLLQIKREEGVSILMASHDSEQVQRIGDQVTRIRRTIRSSQTLREADS